MKTPQGHPTQLERACHGIGIPATTASTAPAVPSKTAGSRPDRRLDGLALNGAIPLLAICKAYRPTVLD